MWLQLMIDIVGSQISVKVIKFRAWEDSERKQHTVNCAKSWNFCCIRLFKNRLHMGIVFGKYERPIALMLVFNRITIMKVITHSVVWGNFRLLINSSSLCWLWACLFAIYVEPWFKMDCCCPLAWSWLDSQYGMENRCFMPCLHLKEGEG